MLTWDMYYNETTRRENEIAQADQDRVIKAVTAECISGLTRISIELLERVGSRLVQWGEKMQCRCAELTVMRTNRAL